VLARQFLPLHRHDVEEDHTSKRLRRRGALMCKYTARIMKNIRLVLYAQNNTPCIIRRVFHKHLLGVYFSQKQGVYLAKNRAYIWPKPTCDLPSLRCRLSSAERALGSRPHMGVPTAAAGCLLSAVDTVDHDH
jgi:hypothetical protein